MEVVINGIKQEVGKKMEGIPGGSKITVPGEIICCQPGANIRFKKLNNKEFYAQGNFYLPDENGELQRTTIKIGSQDGVNWKYWPEVSDKEVVQSFASLTNCLLYANNLSPANVKVVGGNYFINEIREISQIGTRINGDRIIHGSYESPNLTKDELRAIMNFCEQIKSYKKLRQHEKESKIAVEYSGNGARFPDISSRESR